MFSTFFWGTFPSPFPKTSPSSNFAKISPSSSSPPSTSTSSNSGSSIVGYDWCYPSCNDNVQSSFKFSSDGTFTFSTIMFGGMSRRGVWKDLGNGNIQTNDNQVGTQTVRKLSGTQIQVGSTIYNRY